MARGRTDVIAPEFDTPAPPAPPTYPESPFPPLIVPPAALLSELIECSASSTPMPPTHAVCASCQSSVPRHWTRLTSTLAVWEVFPAKEIRQNVAD
jgi:hypothetical protein